MKYTTNEIPITLEQQIAWLKEEVMALTDATEKEVDECMKCPNHKNVVNHYVGNLLREKIALQNEIAELKEEVSALYDSGPHL